MDTAVVACLGAGVLFGALLLISAMRPRAVLWRPNLVLLTLAWLGFLSGIILWMTR